MRAMPGIHMHRFVKIFVFGNDRQMDDVFFIWKGTKEELGLFVCFKYRVQFGLEVEKEGFCRFWILGCHIWTVSCSQRFTGNLHTQQYINWNSNHPKTCYWGC